MLVLFIQYSTNPIGKQTQHAGVGGFQKRKIVAFVSRPVSTTYHFHCSLCECSELFELQSPLTNNQRQTAVAKNSFALNVVTGSTASFALHHSSPFKLIRVCVYSR